jgi:hypothetical protein
VVGALPKEIEFVNEYSAYSVAAASRSALVYGLKSYPLLSSPGLTGRSSNHSISMGHGMSPIDCAGATGCPLSRP